LARCANFADWAAAAVSPAGTPLAWPARDFASCVVTVATGYPADVIKPLVLSLREHSNAPLVIVANAGSGLEKAFAGRDVVVYEVPAAAGYRPYPALARLEYYLDILAGLPGSVGRMLFVDSRDVVFQADPFAGLHDAALQFFAENDDTGSWKLTTTNGRWARMMLPAQMSRALAGKPIVNGGVIAGTPSGLAAMCRAKLDIARQTHEWTKHTTGLDNISTNVVAHAAMVPGTVSTANHTHVANIYRNSPMVLDGGGRIVSPGGRICPIVHMYDRRPDLLAHVNARYGVSGAGLVLGQDRSLTPPDPFANARHWLKLARIRVMGR
jgi:hypothetical protein